MRSFGVIRVRISDPGSVWICLDHGASKEPANLDSPVPLMKLNKLNKVEVKFHAPSLILFLCSLHRIFHLLKNAVKVLQEAEENGKSLLEVSSDVTISSRERGNKISWV